MKVTLATHVTDSDQGLVTRNRYTVGTNQPRLDCCLNCTAKADYAYDKPGNWSAQPVIKVIQTYNIWLPETGTLQFDLCPSCAVEMRKEPVSTGAR